MAEFRADIDLSLPSVEANFDLASTDIDAIFELNAIVSVTKTSQLINDSGFITNEVDDLVNYMPTSNVISLVNDSIEAHNVDEESHPYLLNLIQTEVRDRETEIARVEGLISTGDQAIYDLLDSEYTKTADLPPVYDGVLTIQKNSTDIGTFSANSSSNQTINVEVPTQASDVNALPDTTKYGATLVVTQDPDTFETTITLQDQDGNTLGNPQTVDFPMEDAIVDMSYDASTKNIVLTFQDTTTKNVSIAPLISGLQAEITQSNKLSADLVDDTNTTHKFVTAADKTNWDSKQPAGDYALRSELPTVNNATLTVQQNGTDIAVFSANASVNQVANITVPTQASDIHAMPDSTTISDLVSDEQQDALDSGITSALVTQIGTNQGDISDINTTIGGYGDIVTHDVDEFATAAQGDLADSALQPNDNVSELVNDAGYITKNVDNLTNYTKTTDLTPVNNATLKIQVNSTDVATFTANASQDVTANIEVPDSATWGNISGTLSNQTDLQQALNNKQDTISDLETIRTGAGKGATAVQPNDNITTLTNDAGYITSSDVGEGILTIQKNGTAVDTFSANASADKTINIIVPTKTSDLTNDDGFITGINSSDVTTALGYTPYNATNPSGYITTNDVGKGILTIQKNSTTVDTFSANASADKTINITVPTKTSDLTNDDGFITGITSSDVTTALGYTPYNATNPSGYITSSAVGTGVLTIQKNGATVDTFSANASADKTISITVPTQASDINALPDSTTLSDLANTTEQAVLSSGITSSLVTQIGTNESNISDIKDLIPNEATSNNQLADKEFVNSSIATNTANFIGTFSSVPELEAYTGTVTNNDFAFVINRVITNNGSDWATFAALDAVSKASFTNYDYAWVINGSNFDLYRFDIVNQEWVVRATNIAKADVTLNTAYNRYKASVASNVVTWDYEFTLNNSSFTAVQWAAINSGATTSKISQIATNAGDILDLQTNKADKTDIPTAVSELTNDSGYITSSAVGNATITIQKNGTNVDSFTTNASVNKSINISVPTKTSDLTNDDGFITGISSSDVTTALGYTPADSASLATVATSGDYDDLTDKPTIGNATITITQGNITKGSFTVNQTNNATINLDAAGSTITIDSAMSDTSENPVQNKVITAALADKQNEISDLSDIRSGASAGATALQPNDNVSELTNDAGYITSSAVGTGVLTIQKNGTAVDTFSANASANKSINISVPTKTSDLTNDDGFITGITSSDVTTALGYTPYDASNPSGYITSSAVGTGILTIQKNSTTVDTFSANASANKSINITVPTKTSDLTNDDGFITSSALEGYALESQIPSDVSELNNDSGYITSSAVGTGVLTIQKNGTAVDTFSANASTNKTINITVPTTASDVNALPSTTKYAATITASLNTTTYKLTITLKDQNGDTLGQAQEVDFPCESALVGVSYSSNNKSLILTTQSGSTSSVDISGLISGLQPEITQSNKLSADLVTDTNTTNKFVTAADITNWNSKQPAGNYITYNGSSAIGSGTQGVYVNSSGEAATMTYSLNKTVPSDAVFTDTKNTAGSTDISSKIFLVGATSQAANPQTYSHDTAFVDTSGQLNSANPAAGTNSTVVATTKWVTDKNYASKEWVVDQEYITEGDLPTHALKSYLDEGELLTDEEGLNDVIHYAHSTFDLSKFTKVGNPNITDDGIASGLSQNNRIEIPFNSTGKTNFKIKVPFKFSNTMTLGGSIVWGSAGIGTYCYGTKSYIPSLLGTSGTGFAGSEDLQVGIDYILEIGIENSTNCFFKITRLDTNVVVAEKTWITGRTTEISTLYISQLEKISIDLKQFSITVDGVPVFSGNQTGIDTIKTDNYTIVGSPTISADGIASGFSSGNYLSFASVSSLTTAYQINCEFKTSDMSLLSEGQDICSFMYSSWQNMIRVLANSVSNNSALTLSIIVNGTPYYLHSTNSLLSNTDYEAQLGQLSNGTMFLRYKKVGDSSWIEDITNSSATLINLVSVTNAYIGRAPHINGGFFSGSIDLNSFKIYVDGDLVYQPCLKIPYTESKTGSKIVDSAYGDRVSDMYEQFGYAPYYTLDEGTSFTIPQGEIYGLIEKRDEYNKEEILDYIADNYVNLTGAQTISGVKTFSATPVITSGHLNLNNSGDVSIQKQGTNFLRKSSANDVILSSTGSNGIYFRPNGDNNTTGQAYFATDGNLTAVKFTGPLVGNASTATTLQTTRKINGTDFNGSADITTANWGTSRNIGIINSDGTGTAVTVSVNGSGNVNLKLPATIKADLTGNASSATKAIQDSDGNTITSTYVNLAGAQTITGTKTFSNANTNNVLVNSTSSAGRIAYQTKGTTKGSIGVGTDSRPLFWVNGETTPTELVRNKTYNTATGSATKPVYIDANGVAQACTYSVNKDVPSNAVFTDTNNAVTNTLNNTVKAYITGTTNSATNTGGQVFDSNVYLSATAGELVATKFTGALNGNASTATSATKATQDSDGNAINSTYLKKSGGTMTGAITFANGTWNNIGDDAKLGDHNVGGHICIKPSNSTFDNSGGISFHNSSDTALVQLNASSGALTSSGSLGVSNNACKMVYNSTTEALEFNFA